MMINNIYNRIKRATDGKVFYGVGASPENQDNISIDAMAMLKHYWNTDTWTSHLNRSSWSCG